MVHNPFLESERVYLRPLEEGDFPVCAAWLNDPRVTHYLFYGQLPVSASDVRELFFRQKQNGDVVFIIVEKRTKKPIGWSGLHDIHPRSHKAEFRIVIGDTRVWGKGIGTEVTELMTFYGFDRLHLHRVYLGYTAENTQAGAVYAKVGYKQEGVLRDDIYRNSRFYDCVRMALLRDAYYKTIYPAHKRRFAGSRVKRGDA
jgi:RimJ/RimL family protein N-acetyltransferase